VAAKDCLNCIKSLLDAKADMTIRNNAGETVLHIAAEANSYHALFHLYQWQNDKGTVNDKDRQLIDVNSRTQSGETLLHYSARAGHERCIEFLLRMRADIEARDDQGRTALHAAATRGRTTSAKEVGEENDIASSAGQTPLHVAANERTDRSAEIVRALLAAGADIEAVDKDQKTPLQLAVESDCPNIVDLLLQHNANVGTIDVDSASAEIKAMLHKARCQRKHAYETAVRIMKDEERKAKALNAERIKQGMVSLGEGAYGIVLDGVWHLPDVDSDDLVPSVRVILHSRFKQKKPFLSEKIKSGSVTCRRKLFGVSLFRKREAHKVSTSCNYFRPSFIRTFRLIEAV
jgi:26S proteasome non-ATPase regulatory subunit 10